MGVRESEVLFGRAAACRTFAAGTAGAAFVELGELRLLLIGEKCGDLRVGFFAKLHDLGATGFAIAGAIFEELAHLRGAFLEDGLQGFFLFFGEREGFAELFDTVFDAHLGTRSAGAAFGRLGEERRSGEAADESEREEGAFRGFHEYVFGFLNGN